MASLDKTGLSHFWSGIKTKLNSKSDVGHIHNYADLADKPTLDGCAITGNARSVNGYRIRVVTDENDIGEKGSITFIV